MEEDIMVLWLGYTIIMTTITVGSLLCYSPATTPGSFLHLQLQYRETVDNGAQL